MTPDPVDVVFSALLERCGTDPSSPNLTGPVCREDVAAALGALAPEGLDIVCQERWTSPPPATELGGPALALVPAPAEDKLVDLMAALEESVRQARASRDRLPDRAGRP